jgi:hypothetical protein
MTLRACEAAGFESTQQVKKAEIDAFPILTGSWFAMVSRGRGGAGCVSAPVKRMPMQECACQRPLRDA